MHHALPPFFFLVGVSGGLIVLCAALLLCAGMTLLCVRLVSRARR